MRLVFFDDFRPGLLSDQEVVDIAPALRQVTAPSPQALMEHIIAHFDALRPTLERLLAEGERIPLDRVRLRPPLPRPGKIICCFGNYKEGSDRPVRPLDLFLKSPEAVIGPGDTVVLPQAPATIFHHEAELGVVIKARTRNISVPEAMEAVFGYTCFMDISARGLGQVFHGRGSLMGKSFDTFAPLGPALVTADDVPDPHRLQVRYWVNGEIRHDYSTSDMEHSIAEIVSGASAIMTLLPGDLIACGTNHQGIGPLQDGDQAVIEIPRLGRMAVGVVDPLKRSWPRAIDQEMARRVREG